MSHRCLGGCAAGTNCWWNNCEDERSAEEWVKGAGSFLAGATVARMGEESNNFWIAAIDIEAFIPVDEFRRDMDDFIAYQRSSQPASGHSQVIMPGERDFTEEERRKREGILLPDKIWLQIEDLSGELGVPIEG